MLTDASFGQIHGVEEATGEEQAPLDGLLANAGDEPEDADATTIDACLETESEAKFEITWITEAEKYFKD